MGGFAESMGRAVLLQDGVLESLRRAQADNGLGLDLDRFTRRRVAAHASLAMCLHSATDIGDDELPGALGFLDGELEQLVEEAGNLLLGDRLVGSADLVSHVRDDLGLAQRSCHRILLPPQILQRISTF